MPAPGGRRGICFGAKSAGISWRTRAQIRDNPNPATSTSMGFFDAIWHLGNLFWPALGLGALAAAAARLLWWRELRGQTWLRLAGPACVANCAVTLAGLVLWGRDGRMATYGAMLLACSISLWWQAFGPGRRR
jgi:hypothetical protein